MRVSIHEQGGAVRQLSFDKAEVTVGRTPENDLCLTGPGVSGRHCRFVRAPQGVYVEDLGSTNGTYLNRQRLGGPQYVSPSDEIVVAMYQLRVDPTPAPVGATASVPPAVAGGLGSSYGVTGAPPVTSRSMQPADRSASLATASASRPPSVPPGVARGGGPGEGDGSPLDSSGAQWAREWEKIDMFTRAWAKAGRDKAELLRGEKLAHARRWLASGSGKHPAPKPEHREFIRASVRARQGRVIRNLSLGALGAGAVGVAVWQLGPVVGPDDAETVVTAPVDPTEEAERPEVPTTKIDPDAERKLSNTLAGHARAQLASDPELAALLAAEGLSRLPVSVRGSAAEAVLRAALEQLRGAALRGHTGRIHAALFSADGRWAVTGSADRSARLWDLSAEGAIRPLALRGHGEAVTALATSDDARYLFTGAADGTVFRWDLKHEQPHTTSVIVPGHDTGVTAMVVSTDGKWLVTGCSDGSLRIFDAAAPSMRGRKAADGHAGPIRAVDITADASIVASGGEDGLAMTWRIDDEGAPRRRARVEGHEGAVRDVALSPEGHWLLTGSEDGTARLWDPTRRIPALGHRVLHGHEGPVNHVEITPDGTLALTGGDDDRILVWNLGIDEPELSAVRFDLHTGDILALEAQGPAAGEKGERLALSGSADGTARTWNLDRREREQDSVVLGVAGPAVTAVALAPRSRFALTGNAEGSAQLWDPHARGPIGAAKVARGHDAQVLDVAVNVVGTRMATASADGTGRVWDLTRDGSIESLGVLKDHQGRVRTVAIDADGRYVATAGEDGIVRLWALDKPDPGAAHLPLRGHKRVVNQLEFTPDGSALVSISADRTARYWRLTQTPEKDAVVLPHREEVNSMAITSDGRWLLTGTLSELRLWDLKAPDVVASAKTLGGQGKRKLHDLDIVAVGIGPRGTWAVSTSADPAVVLWNLAAGGEATRLRRHDEVVDAVAFSPDGRWLATGSRDTTIRLWDLSAEHPDETSLELRGHTQRVGSLQFSTDSKRLLSAGYDNAIRLWDLSSGKADAISEGALVLTGHDDLVSAVTFSADESFIASASYDGSARVWPLDPPSLLRIACRRVGRSLTHEEWDRWVGGDYRSTCSADAL